MLKPKYLEQLPENMIKLCAQAEQDILADAARRLSTYDYWIPAADHQYRKLIEMGNFHSYVMESLSSRTGKSSAELERLMQEAGRKALAFDTDIYKQHGLKPPPLAASVGLQRILKAGLEKTNGLFHNLTETTANTVTKQFENALDRAYMQITTGAFDYNTAIRMAVKDLAQQGVGSVMYASGHVDTIETAVRRAVVTGVNQTALRLQWSLADEMGCDLVETTAHAGARPEHALWQGQIFSRSGKSLVYPKFASSTGYGSGEGLGGWNCRHSFFPYFEGTARTYTPEILKEFEAKTCTYNGQRMTEYEASQKQRYIERKIRRWKREEASMKAAGQPTHKASAKVRQWQSTQRDFLKQTGLKRQSAREQVAKINLSGRILSSGKAGDTNGYTVLNSVTSFDFSSKAAINEAINDFCKKYRFADVEHSLVLSPDGHAYALTGLEGVVNTTLAGDDALLGAIVIHNHPVTPGEIMADSFSRHDVEFAIVNKTNKQYLISGERRNAFTYTGEATAEEVYDAYHLAKDDVLERACSGEIEIIHEQEEIMKVMEKYLKGFVFYESF